MNIEKGFKFVFQEKNWLGKIVVGGLMILFSFLIIPLLIYYGYLVEVTKRTVKGEEQILPEWDNIGHKIALGFKLAVIIIVYLLPFLILIGLSIPFTDFEFDNMRSREIVLLIPMLVSNFLFRGEFTGISLLFFFSSLIYIVLFILILPFIVGKFSENESINDAFAISDILSMFRDNFGDAVVIFLLTVFLQLLASLGIVLCFVGILLTGFWASVVQYYLYGELYKKSLKTKPTMGI